MQRWFSALLILLAFAGPSIAGGIKIDGFYEGTIPGSAGDKTILVNFDASSSDKLVVTLGGEHGFPQNTGGHFYYVTYGGSNLTEAVQEDVSYPTTAIFYLDNPGLAGDVVINQANHNGSMYGVYLLSGTHTGICATATATTNTVELTTTVARSMVIAVINNSGPDGANGAPNMSAVPPLVEDTLTDLEVGKRYSSLSCGHQYAPAVGVTTNAFSGNGATDVLSISAAEVPPAPPPGMVLVVR